MFAPRAQITQLRLEAFVRFSLLLLAILQGTPFISSRRVPFFLLSLQ